MRFLSVCSGIEAASVAWAPLGWSPVAFAEIEAFPSAVLEHHYPTVPNRGDITKFKDWPDADVDLLCGGTPCQSFSVAGNRAGLDDPRGDLMLTFGAIAARYRPRWLVWENVPGVLSTNGGRDFGAFLGMLAKLGYGFAYRILDAQFFGVPQRRRRVFVVGCTGDWRAAAAVLFERHSLSGHPAPSRKARKDFTGSTGDGIARCLTTREGSRQDWGSSNMIAHAFDARLSDVIQYGDISGPIDTDGHSIGVMASMAVRRLTPTECERLMGLPDEYTAVPYRGKSALECPDSPRYRAIGNSWAVPVARWVGERIAACEAINGRRRAGRDYGGEG